MTENVPYHNLKMDIQVMFVIVFSKKSPQKPKEMSVTMEALWGVCKGCWARKPDKRWKILDVVEKLSYIESVAEGRALMKTSSEEKRSEGEGSEPRSKLSKGKRTARPEEESRATLLPECNEDTENKRRLTVMCMRVSFLLLV